MVNAVQYFMVQYYSTWHVFKKTKKTKTIKINQINHATMHCYRVVYHIVELHSGQCYHMKHACSFKNGRTRSGQSTNVTDPCGPNSVQFWAEL